MTRILLFLLISSFSSCDSNVTIQKIDRPSEDIIEDIAFVHVNVITMESEHVLMDQTVLVHNSQIESIAPSSSNEISTTYFQIDAKGAYLMPGLSDMHTHIWYKDDLLPYVANGITTVLHMGGPSIILDFRKQALNKEIISPSIFASGFVDGPNSRGWYARTPQEGEEAVSEIKAGGWDFIKVYNSIPLDAYQALMAKAKTENMPVIGHGVRAPGMQGILTSGQAMIAHAEEYLYTYFNNSTDESKIAEAVTITKKAGAYVTPNLCTYETIARQWGNPTELQRLLSLPEMKYVSPKWRDNFWMQFDFATRGGNINNQYAFLKKLTKAFSDGGVPLLLGTDTPYIIGQSNGYAIHDDLRNLMECGLTPYQALSIGTKNAGEFINKFISGSKSFGMIKQGYKADLILLQSNPLSNLNALKDRVGVMINGRWLSEKRLKEEMEKLAGSY
ncbi:amidohydrolase family protein [soil metagenome]